MKLGRILGVVLSMLALMGGLNKNIFSNSQDSSNAFELGNTDGIISDSRVDYGSSLLNSENNNNVDYLTFTNKESYPVEIGSSNITVTCLGNGISAESDASLVKNNLSIKALFSESKTGKKVTSLVVEPKEKIYVFTISEFVGDIYPENEVNCNYNIDIQAS